MESRGHELPRDTMGGLAGYAVGNWLFFAVGIPPSAMLASIMFISAAVRSSLRLSTQWWRATMNRYLLPVIAVIVAAGLASCAGQSEWHVQFFNASGSAQVDQRYVHIMTVTQNAQTPPLSR